MLPVPLSSIPDLSSGSRAHSATPLSRWTRDGTRHPDFASRIAAMSQLPDLGAVKPSEEPLTPSITTSIAPGTSILVHPPTSVMSSGTSVAPVGPSSIITTTATESIIDVQDDTSSSRRSSSSDSSDALPPLTRGPSIASNDSGNTSVSGPPLSAVTELASFFSTHPLLEESESNPGVLLLPETLRPPADYTCPFHILDCTETFEAPHLGHFKCHVMSHFRGMDPPAKAKCPLCDAVYRASPSIGENGASGSRIRCDPSSQAWDSMLTHLAQSHFGQGERLKTARPDFELYTYMWKRRLISDATYKSLQMEPARFGRNRERRDGRAVMHGAHVIVPPQAPSPPRQSVGFRDEPFVAHMSTREERRARRRGRP